MVASFGEFVAGDKIVVGMIIFVIIVVIQFVVITKGATRISEVAARFALDGMPGKQMAIDADLNAGIIDEREAQARRQRDHAAGRFFRGDGRCQQVRPRRCHRRHHHHGDQHRGRADHRHGRVRHDARPRRPRSYTQLTIGDGLVSQVPAFLISLAAGLLVTRSTQKSNLPREFMQQIFSRPQALAVTGGFLGDPGVHELAADSAAGAWPGRACGIVADDDASRVEGGRGRPCSKADDDKKAKPPEERVEDYLTVDPMEIEIGVGLIRLADPNRGGDLLDRVQRVRQNMAGEIGIIMPKVRIRDNMRLEREPVSHQDRRHAGGRRTSLQPTQLLAIDSGMTTGKVDGIADEGPGVRHRREVDQPGPGAIRPRCTATRSSSRARAGDASDRSRAAGMPTKFSPATRRSI